MQDYQFRYCFKYILCVVQLKPQSFGRMGRSLPGLSRGRSTCARGGAVSPGEHLCVEPHNHEPPCSHLHPSAPFCKDEIEGKRVKWNTGLSPHVLEITIEAVDRIFCRCTCSSLMYTLCWLGDLGQLMLCSTEKMKYKNALSSVIWFTVE